MTKVKAVAIASRRKTTHLQLCCCKLFRDVQKTEAQSAFALLQPKSKKKTIYIAPGVSVQKLLEADIFLLELRSPSAHLESLQRPQTDARIDNSPTCLPEGSEKRDSSSQLLLKQLNGRTWHALKNTPTLCYNPSLCFLSCFERGSLERSTSFFDEIYHILTGSIKEIRARCCVSMDWRDGHWIPQRMNAANSWYKTLVLKYMFHIPSWNLTSSAFWMMQKVKFISLVIFKKQDSRCTIWEKYQFQKIRLMLRQSGGVFAFLSQCSSLEHEL